MPTAEDAIQSTKWHRWPIDFFTASAASHPIQGVCLWQFNNTCLLQNECLRRTSRAHTAPWPTSSAPYASMERAGRRLQHPLRRRLPCQLSAGPGCGWTAARAALGWHLWGAAAGRVLRALLGVGEPAGGPGLPRSTFSTQRDGMGWGVEVGGEQQTAAAAAAANETRRRTNLSAA